MRNNSCFIPQIIAILPQKIGFKLFEMLKEKVISLKIPTIGTLKSI